MTTRTKAILCRIGFGVSLVGLSISHSPENIGDRLLSGVLLPAVIGVAFIVSPIKPDWRFPRIQNVLFFFINGFVFSVFLFLAGLGAHPAVTAFLLFLLASFWGGVHWYEQERQAEGLS